MKFTATYEGQTVTRLSKKAYTHAAVVHTPWDNATGIWSFHTSKALAEKGQLTGEQKKNGARVVAVIEVTAL